MSAAKPRPPVAAMPPPAPEETAVPSWPDSMLLDDPVWAAQVLELALRGAVAEAHGFTLDAADLKRMFEPPRPCL